MGVRYLLWLGVACLVAMIGSGWAGDELSVSVLDVGQGDAILIQDGATQMLVDGGPGRSVLREMAEVMPMFDRTVEVMVVTHPQQDHMEGLVAVLERYEVGLMILPEVVDDSALYDELLAALEEKQVAYAWARVVQTVAVGRFDVVILNPMMDEVGRELIADDLNNASVVMRVEGCASRGEGGSSGCMSWLLTGDAERGVEQRLAREVGSERLRSDVLKVGHHGSNSSSTAGFLEAVGARAAIISVGQDNRFGHPHPAVLERLGGLLVWRTDRDGRVRFWWGGEQWFIKA